MSGETVDGGKAREPPSRRPSQWRDKIKSATKLKKGSKLSQEQAESNVADFLGSGPRPQPPTPRLDTSASITHYAPVTDHEERDEPLQYGTYPSPQPPPRKRPKPRDLHVTFTHLPPEIIGEGGDESDVPAREVVNQWIASEKPYHMHDEMDHEGIHQKKSWPPPDLLKVGLDSSSRRASFQRTPTRHTAPGDWEDKRRSMNMKEGLVQAYKPEPDEVPGLVEPGLHAEPTLPNLLAEPTLPSLQVEQNFPDLASLPPLVGDSSHLPIESSRLLLPQNGPGNSTARAVGRSSSFDASRNNSVEGNVYQPAPYQVGRRPVSQSDADPSIKMAFVPYNPSRQSAVNSVVKVAPLASALDTQDFAFRHAPHGQRQSHNESPSMSTPADAASPPIVSQEDIRSFEHEQPHISPYMPSAQFPPAQDQHHRQSGNYTGTMQSSAEAAGEDLYSRMQHLRGMFRLTAGRVDTTDKEAIHWLRASAWWFLRGKFMLESSLRASSQTSEKPGNRPSSSWSAESKLPQNKQCYVDLAKAWWIMEEILPDIMHLQTAERQGGRDRIDGVDNAQLIDVNDVVRKDMQTFALSLQQRDLMPPHQLVVQGADPEIWISYPKLPPGMFALTANLDPRTLSKTVPPDQVGFFPMPTADTVRFFSYGRVFGDVELMNDHGDETLHFPCVISILRDRTSSHVEVVVTSQDGQINFHVQPDRNAGPTWHDVEWKINTHSVGIRLARDFDLVLRLREADFKTLWGIQDYNKRVQFDRDPKDNEDLLFEDCIESFHYIAPQGVQSGFPTSPVKTCQVRVFQKNLSIHEGSGTRSVFDGYRVVAVTPPYVKTISSLSRTIGEATPVLVTSVRGDNGSPAMLISVAESGKKASMILTFDNPQKREEVRMILAGIATSPDECYSENITLESMALSKLANDASETPAPALPPTIQWQNLRIINQGHSLEEGANLFSTRLRICIQCNYGSITDRINLGTGELRIGLEVTNINVLKFYRPAQDSLLLCFAENIVPKVEVPGLQLALASATASPSLRVYQFKSLAHLHQVQTLVTGFSIIYDGLAPSFAISRRRMVVPIYKRLEATRARIQVIQDASRIQLLLFLLDFGHGKCMNFTLKGTDVYESFGKSGKFYVRFVDAKFTMPKTEKEVGWDLCCLDQVEYPTEHDDITVGFGTEDERESFAKALPAPVKKVSWMASMRH